MCVMNVGNPSAKKNTLIFIKSSILGKNLINALSVEKLLLTSHILMDTRKEFTLARDFELFKSMGNSSFIGWYKIIIPKIDCKMFYNFESITENMNIENLNSLWLSFENRFNSFIHRYLFCLFKMYVYMYIMYVQMPRQARR